LEASQVAKLGPAEGRLHYIIRARADHHFEVPNVVSNGHRQAPSGWWAAVALEPSTSDESKRGPFRDGLLLVGAAAPLHEKRIAGVPLGLRCAVDDQFALGSPDVMDAYASLFPDLTDDFTRLLLVHRNDANGHTNERVMVRPWLSAVFACLFYFPLGASPFLYLS
jgi:hypothetical protein